MLTWQATGGFSIDASVRVEGHDQRRHGAPRPLLRPLTIKRWLLRHPRYHLHFTPTGASRMHLVESWFSVFTRKRPRRSAHPSTRSLEQTIRDYLDSNNQDPKPFAGTRPRTLAKLGIFSKSHLTQ
jgi:hypothetical protein